MKITDDFIKQHLLEPVYLNGRGSHLISKCPFCKREDHLYVQTKTSKTNSRGENVSFMWQCKRCGENGRIRKLFNALGKLNLLSFGKDVKIDEGLKLIEKYKKNEVVLELDTPTKTPPLGYRRVKKHPYLESRGFDPIQYRTYNVGVTTFGTDLKNYVIALVEEDGECKGHVARCTLTNTQLDAENVRLKQLGYKSKMPRYKNSVNTEFAKLLMGIDEITHETIAVIIVEGFFDKTNVDKLLQLNSGPKCKCVVSFGKKLSIEQIAKLKMKGKNVKTVNLLYDPDAVDESKQYAFKLKEEFEDVRIGFLKEKDPGDLNLDELNEILQSAEKPMSFSINKVQRKIKTR